MFRAARSGHHQNNYGRKRRSRLVSSEDNQTASTTATYGKDWVLFPDDYGGLHFANLSVVSSPIERVGRQVYFHLYTQRNKDEYEELFIDNQSTYNYFEPELPIKFITHGWMSGGDSSAVIDIKDAYLSNQNLNAVVVDWHEIADDMVYVTAAMNTRYVGYKISQLTASMSAQYNVTGERVHLIGHSLGAHVMGFAGQELRKHNITVSRITGLDPARPLFEFPPLGGLSSEDAEFVDIIHTCAGVLGYKRSYGHADFYPNDGSPPQPGCDGMTQLVDACSHARAHQYFAESINSEVGFLAFPCTSLDEYRAANCRDNLIQSLASKSIITDACSHARAHQYFAESINSELGFVAFPCNSYDEFRAANCRDNSTLMGDPADNSSRGDYYLRTNTESQYARGNSDGEQ